MDFFVENFKSVRRATRFLVTINNFHIIKIMSIIDPFEI